MITPSNSALLAALLASYSSAAPTDARPTAQHLPTTGTFSVAQVAAPNYVKHGSAQMAKTLMKYGVSLPDNLAKIMADLKAMRAEKLAQRSTGSAVTTPEQYDIQYLTPVEIGTPAQKLNLDFDSGSSDLWVFSSETAKSSVKGQSIYTPSKSSTSSRVDGATWDISYGDGSSSSGNVYLDLVNIGGVSFDKQAVESATKVSSSFSSDSENDGLLGLAFSSINTVQPKSQKTFFDNLISKLDAPVWTVDLKKGAPGTYNFGFVDKSLYTGDIAYASVDNSKGFWMFTMDGYGIGSDAVGTTKIKGIADTGTTLAMLPDAVVTAYYKKVSGSSFDSINGGYVFPCSTSPPDFKFAVAGMTITVPGNFINYAPADSAGKSCFGGIQSDSGVGFSIFGDIILKAAFVVFEDKSSAPRIGWANKKL